MDKLWIAWIILVQSSVDSVTRESFYLFFSYITPPLYSATSKDCFEDHSAHCLCGGLFKYQPPPYQVARTSHWVQKMITISSYFSRQRQCRTATHPWYTATLRSIECCRSSIDILRCTNNQMRLFGKYQRHTRINKHIQQTRNSVSREKAVPPLYR